MERIITTYEMEEYINNLFLSVLENIGVDRKLINTNFSIGTPNSIEGTYAFSDGEKYHYLFTEKGSVKFHKTTSSLMEITYWILDIVIFEFSMKYATDNRKEGEDFRRKLFDKEIEIWSLFGEYYYKRKKNELEEILKNNPYVDKN